MSELKVNKISPATGTAFALGDSGDTFTLPSGATIVNSGTATGFGGGKVLQIQSALSATFASTTTTMGFDDTIPQNTEGVELVTLAFTPLSTGSKLLFIYGGNFNMGAGGGVVSPLRIAMFVDSTANAFAAGTATVEGGGTRVDSSWTFHLEANSSTSARTYKMRWAKHSSTAYVNGDTSNRFFGGLLNSGFYVIEFEN
jgi:hypothetical protein